MALLLVVGVGVAAVELAGRRLQLAAIDRHERQWERERPDDYSYRLELRCFCFGTRSWRVTVEDGRVVAVDPDGLDEKRPPTIERLFEIAREAVRAGADDVDVEYSGTDGHPTLISVDQMEQSIDDEYGYVVRDFEARR